MIDPSRHGPCLHGVCSLVGKAASKSRSPQAKTQLHITIKYNKGKARDAMETDMVGVANIDRQGWLPSGGACDHPASEWQAQDSNPKSYSSHRFHITKQMGMGD